MFSTVKKTHFSRALNAFFISVFKYGITAPSPAFAESVPEFFIGANYVEVSVNDAYVTWNSFEKNLVFPGLMQCVG